MTLVAVHAREGNWLDCNQPLSDAVLEAVAAAGYEGVARYVPLPGNNSMYDCSSGELARICATKKPNGQTLQCLLVQHPRVPRFNDLTRHNASGDASHARQFALDIGYPTGCHLVVDVEGLKGDHGELAAANTRDVVVVWLEAWAAWLAGVYRGMMYLGYDVPLSAADAYSLRGIDQYWSDAGHRQVATRGCSMTQGGGSLLLQGTKFDRDVVRADLLGDLPMVAQAA